MRKIACRIAILAAFTLGACAPGAVVVVRQPPPPPPPRPRIEPLEVTLGRPIRGHMIVQTNRPSYVALFEIVPDRGVALLAPAYAHQRTWVLVGLNWVPVSWSVQSALYYGRPATTSVPARWVYAIASDEPLQLPDEAFRPGYLRRVLGPVAYRASNPYVTMRAIARAFVPAVVDEAWAEDAYAIPATHSSDAYRTVRIYCANRTVYEVPEEMAHRVWCPVQRAPGSTTVRSAPTRPDSVVATNGQRARRLPSSWPARTPIDRVQEPPRTENTPVTTDNTPPRTDPTNTDVKDVKDSKEPKDWKEVVKERMRGGGNKYGHTDDPNVKGRGIENEKRDTVPQNDPRREPRIETPVIDKTPPVEKAEEKQEKQEEKQIRHEEKQEEKLEKREKSIEKQEEKVEKKEEKVEKHEDKADKHEEKAAKQEEKTERPVSVDPPPPPPEAPPPHREEPKAEPREEKQEPKEEKKQNPKEDKKPETKEDKQEQKGKP
jgi:hypothetical protein